MKAPRWLALYPLLGVAAAAFAYAADGTLPELLWTCNMANLGLAAALLAQSGPGLWIAALWLIVGVPIWLIEVATQGWMYPHSPFTHFGSAVLAVWCLRGVPRLRVAPLLAYASFVPLWVVTRYAAPAALNINLSHRPHDSLAGVFSNFPLYLLFTAACIIAGMWIAEVAVARIAGSR